MWVRLYFQRETRHNFDMRVLKNEHWYNMII